MRDQQIALFMFASLMAAPGAAAQVMDWQAVEKLAPNTRIWVKAQRQTYCYFQGATEDELFCEFVPKPSSSQKQDSDLVFNRNDVCEVRIAAEDDYDYSKGSLSLIIAAGSGGGWDFTHRPNAFGGIKIGGEATLDLQYDRIQGHSGFSTEGSAVLPLFRLPGYKPFKERKFVKVFAEPGVGYRAGAGSFGGYGSAKAMAVLLTDTWSDKWVAPYVEFQRRFPFGSPLQGDNRIGFGVMLVALCEHCGLN
jgi:hypothetical protein